MLSLKPISVARKIKKMFVLFISAKKTKPKRPMSSDNRISLKITAAQNAALVSAVNALKTALDGILINLTPDEKQSLPRIGDNSMAFDEKCAAYMASRADLVPSFLDAEELAKDRKLVADLLPCFRELAPLCVVLKTPSCWRTPTTWWAIWPFTKMCAKRLSAVWPLRASFTTT